MESMYKGRQAEEREGVLKRIKKNIYTEVLHFNEHRVHLKALSSLRSHIIIIPIFFQVN